MISEEFLKLFGKGSNPEEIASKYPEVEAIREVFKGVHRQTLKELKEVPEEVLDEPAGRPHPMFQTKLGALEWCVHHEYVHAGQIGLLRRLLGKEPLR